MLFYRQKTLLIFISQRERKKMVLKVLIIVVAAFVQLAVSQGQQQPGFSGPEMTTSQMWDPYTWAPYFAAGVNAWAQYLQKAQDMSQQFYPYRDKSGAGEMISAGMNFAQLASREAQKAAAMAMKQAQQYRMNEYIQG